MNKKIIKIFCLILNLLILMTMSVYGVNASYTITDIYRFTDSNPNAKVELFIGTTDSSKYSFGDCTITPSYSTIKQDDYGNRIAVFNDSTLKKNNYKIIVKKNINTSTIETNINYGNSGNEVSDIYLKPSSKVECNNQLIIDKANELSKNCVDDYSKIRNFFEFVNLNMTYDTSDKYRNQGALSAIKTYRGVCEDYACLFVALCRASNIPARVITGYNFGEANIGDIKEAKDIAHAWAEVYMEGYGWLPIEATVDYTTINHEKVVYWDGLLQLKQPTHIFNGINNPNIYQITCYGIEFLDRDCKIKLNNTIYFNDINNHWAKNNIESLYNKSVIKGYEDGNFRPQNNVTRIEFLVMLCRSLKNNRNTYYSNIDTIYYPNDFINNWAKEEYDRLMLYYAYASEDYTTQHGAGYNSLTYVFGNTLRMNDYITREEVVALMSPFLQNTYSDNVPLSDISNSKFKEDIMKSYMNNIIKGYEDGTFNPKGNITRAEMATVLDRYTK